MPPQAQIKQTSTSKTGIKNVFTYLSTYATYTFRVNNIQNKYLFRCSTFVHCIHPCPNPLSHIHPLALGQSTPACAIHL